METEHPEYFATRSNLNRFVEVILPEGRDAFIRAMIDSGLKLKD